MGLFLPAEIAVQVKWKQGVDENDEESVRQIVKWAKSEGSNAREVRDQFGIGIHRRCDQTGG